ncbi:MAG: DPP IV N-terminal domain-containing protein [Anaerolineae bacterium]
MADQQGGDERGVHPAGNGEGRLRRLWRRIVFAGRWIRRPNAVGQPITLQPRSARLLLLLILGNVAALVLLGVALRQAMTMSTAERPTRREIVTVPPSQPSPAPGPTPTALGRGGAIAFSLKRGGNADIYALDQGTGRLVRLTHHPAEDRCPTWSPDGNYIAFASNRADNWDIYLLDLVSGALIRLTRDPSFDANPSWSPDGQWIAFESYREGNLDVYVMSTAGKQLRALTTDPAPDYAPAWAPDSGAIVFTSLRDGSKDVFLRSLDDEEVVNLTQSPDLDEDAAAWSADASRLAYVSGPQSHTSVQVVGFDWETLSADRARTEFFGTGRAPAWAPDGESLIYAYEREGRSHVVAASMTGWAMFHEVYAAEGVMDDLAWSDTALSPRVLARAEDADPSAEQSLYTEVVQPTPAEGVPYELVVLPGVSTEEGVPFLSDQVNDSFNALRRRVAEEAGWDYLAGLDRAAIGLDHVPPTGQSRKSWHLCGRAFALGQEPYQREEPMVELVREEVGNSTYWRVFVRAAKQDGSMGEPLRDVPWDLDARRGGGGAAVDGGAPRGSVPAGYYVDFTALASDYGWERVPADWRWRTFWPDIRWWEFRKTGDLTWWDCMLEVFESEEIESAFGPIPGREG